MASPRLHQDGEDSVKAPDFMYERPETLADALALLGDAEREAQPLAGGQSLMPMMNFRLAAPEVPAGSSSWRVAGDHGDNCTDAQDNVLYFKKISSSPRGRVGSVASLRRA